MTSIAQSIQPLSEKYQALLIKQHLWCAECPIPLSRLREVTVNYYDFENHLYINKIKLTSDYNGNDEASMEDNNTSAFSDFTCYG